MTSPEPLHPTPQTAAPPAERKLHIVDDHHHPIYVRGIHQGLSRARGFRTRLFATDALIIAVVVAGVFIARTTSEGFAALGYWVVPLLLIALWLVSMGVFHTRDSRVLCTGAAEYKRVISSSTMTFGLLAIAFVITQAEFTRWYFIVALPLGTILLLLNRWGWRRWLTNQGRAGQSLSQVLVVGQGPDVDYVVRQIASKSSAAYTVVGAVVAEDGATPPSQLPGGIPVTTDIDNVAATAARLGADAVVVAGTPSGRADFVRNLAWELEGTATELILATGLANVAGPRIHLRPMEGLPLIHVEIPQFEGGKHVLKRAFDIAVSGVALIVLSPLLAVLAIIVKLDSPGPALFRQERVGRDGQSFTIVKFRSMVTTATTDLAGLLDSNEGAGVLFKMKNDPRVTRFGRFMRKHSLDELPQLWNIFVGDMSVVGPRPPLPDEVRGYETHVHRRLYIRPGLTGMWQVNGRSNLGWEESVQLDLYYVENWSLIGDLMIMWRTVRVLVNPTGAY
jgi:exopolysaccharide biosynthesis polyprenyl glycosylphosphotransferase